MKALKCNRCDCYFDLDAGSLEINTIHCEVSDTYDICPKCSSDLLDWISGKTVMISHINYHEIVSFKTVCEESVETLKELKEALMNKHTIEIMKNGDSTISYKNPVENYTRIIRFEKLIDGLSKAILNEEG